MPRTFSAPLIVAAAFMLIGLAAEAQGQAKAPPPLPDGKGKQLVEGMCAGCHVLQVINNSYGYTREHWKELVDAMVDLSGSKAQQDEVLDYLATHFPPGYNKRPAKPVPGT